jgi:hypothetical protein
VMLAPRRAAPGIRRARGRRAQQQRRRKGVRADLERQVGGIVGKGKRRGGEERHAFLDAIVHLPTLPKELLHDINVIEEFGTAAVARRLGPSVCPDAERLATRAATSLLHFVDRHLVVLE